MNLNQTNNAHGHSVWSVVNSALLVREIRPDAKTARCGILAVPSLILLLGLLAQLPAQGQWTAPQLVTQNVTDNWTKHYSDGSKHESQLSMTRESGGLQQLDYVYSPIFQWRYGMERSTQTYKAWQWDGSAYKYKLFSGDTWNCCLADMPWPAWEHIQFGQQGYSEWRSKNTLVNMKTGGSERSQKYVLLVASAWAYTAWNGITPTASQQLAHDQIHVGGAFLNPDFRRFRRVDANATLSSTVYATVNSYGFDVQVDAHKRQTLTSSRHPNAAYRDWQIAFDFGSDAMGKDDDGDGNSGASEDQGCYVEFIIKPAANSVFPTEFQDGKFDFIRDGDNLDNLLDASFANVKTVTAIEIEYPENPGITNIFSGYAVPPSDSMVLDSGASGITVVHEYGHLNGLEHRSDPNAIMYNNSASKNEVNGAEVASFESAPLQVLGL